MPRAGEEAGVASLSAGEVEDTSAREHQWGETRDPCGRGWGR
jgi:hypothetical protein